ncbi:MAG: hypothetical protein MJK10_03720 [Pseudomonadales bacterium]|nr:hypothetical protein [Pseudomonadales bacterium]NRA15179.1 hypothetical protein [Oceanospirillaceae bacterium]
MSNITLITNPLMQPIQYKGQMYFTSHYFHQAYRNNSGSDGGKYEKQKDFMRLIRSIEAYSNYIDAGDIVELTREEAGAAAAPALKTDPKLGSVFKATFGKPIMLINATAQIALTHHLDDEISKQTSVNVNRRTALELPAADSFAQVSKNHRARLQMAKMSGLKGNKALLAANNWTMKEDGINVLENLGITKLVCEVQAAELTATEIGEGACIPGNGQGKAQNVNLYLWHIGLLDSFYDRKKRLVWRISEKGMKSEHLEYDDMEKSNAKRGSMQVIVYRETLIPLLKNAGLNLEDYKELKAERKTRSQKEGEAA